MTLDEQNGNEFWSKAITTEMTKVKVAFELRELGAGNMISVPEEYNNHHSSSGPKMSNMPSDSLPFSIPEKMDEWRSQLRPHPPSFKPWQECWTN